MTKLNLLAEAAALPTNPKAKALEAVAPNAYFEPGYWIPILTVLFFILSIFLVIVMLKGGGGKDYGE